MNDQEMIPESTKLKSIMLRKGVLSKRDFTKIGKVECDFLANIGVELIKFTTLKGKDISVSFGVKLEASKDDEDDKSALLDMDEVPDFMSAIHIVTEAKAKLVTEKYDYSEMTYSTKDGVRVGLYKTEGRVQFFIHVDGRTVFLNADAINEILSLMNLAQGRYTQLAT